MLVLKMLRNNVCYFSPPHLPTYLVQVTRPCAEPSVFVQVPERTQNTTILYESQFKPMKINEKPQISLRIAVQFSDVFWGQSGRARHVSRAIARDMCRVVAPGFPKGRRRDWMAFWVPEEFSDVFWGHCAGHVPRSFAGVSKRAGDMIGCYVFIGLVHSMSCVFGCLEKFGCGANMEAVLPFWWPVLVVRWLFQLR